jgi:hypothetical protein
MKPGDLVLINEATSGGGTEVHVGIYVDSMMIIENVVRHAFLTASGIRKVYDSSNRKVQDGNEYKVLSSTTYKVIPNETR